MYKNIIFLILIILLPCAILAQEIDYFFNPVVVTANRYPTSISTINRNITVLDSVQLRAMPVQSIQDILAYVAGVDMQRRAPFGIQAQAGVRGGSFEETLILVDGVAVNDPQTAHHNFDLPVSIQDIDRVEILHGQGSGIYGADALAGVIHIITKNTSNKSMTLHAGEHGLAGADLTIAGKAKSINSRLSTHASRSDGYAPYTDFEQINIHNKTGYQWSDNSTELLAGYNQKSFGANSFYSTTYPNERETTKTLLFSSASEIHAGPFMLFPQLSWKRHKDDFILDNSRPSWYRNRHTTTVTGLQLPVYYKSRTGLWGLGAQIRKEEITSSNLGNHNRKHGGIYASWASPRFSKLHINTNLYLYHYDKWGWKSWPSMEVSYQLTQNYKLHTAGGLSFRNPSFTELYYVSPANMGNPELKYSRAGSIEIGISRQTQKARASFCIYERKGKNVIDWARQSSGSPWQVMNIAKLNTTGIESNMTLNINQKNLKNIHIGFSYIHANKGPMLQESKYALNYLRYHAQLGSAFELPLHVNANIQLQWKKRVNRPSYLLCDLGVTKSIKKIQLKINATNLFNTDYYEIEGIPMPGRWITTEIGYTF